MVNKKRIVYYDPVDYNNISLLSAFGRIFLGMFLLLGFLAIMDIFIYLSVTGGEYTSDTQSSYDVNYTTTYVNAYQDAYAESYQAALADAPEREASVAAWPSADSLTALKIPTYAEIITFLVEDNTDKNEYIAGEYNCFDFTADLNNIAAEQGIRAGYISVRAEGWAHALVAFETSDRGVIFVEPQSDKIVEIETGKPYPWWMAGAFKPSLIDDPVEEIRIIW